MVQRAGDIRPEQTRLEGGAMWDKDDEVRPLSDSSLFFDGSPPVPVTARTHTHHQTKWRCSPERGTLAPEAKARVHSPRPHGGPVGAGAQHLPPPAPLAPLGRGPKGGAGWGGEGPLPQGGSRSGAGLAAGGGGGGVGVLALGPRKTRPAGRAPEGR
eukprot:91466-Prorocentrum_minimum.AAC.3